MSPLQQLAARAGWEIVFSSQDYIQDFEKFSRPKSGQSEKSQMFMNLQMKENFSLNQLKHCEMFCFGYCKMFSLFFGSFLMFG